MVRTARAASAAVAGDERPVGHPGQRGDAPANPGGARRGPLGVLHGALADARGVRCRAARSGAARMAGSRLPATSPGPSRHRRGRRRRGWPDTEAGLRTLPGVGAYTARALRVLAFGESTIPPQDVNIARVTARAALGSEPQDVRRSAIEKQLAAGRPRSLSPRDFTYALFDAGALHCRARPLCHGCPLTATCASRSRLASAPPARGRPSPRYHGSTRELRGAVLRAMLADPAPASIEELRQRAGQPAADRTTTDVALILDTLVHEGLVAPAARMVRIN